MNILSIESSCDETAAAIISGDPFSTDQNNKKPEVLSNIIVSQIDIFKTYGGVIPEIAARSHLEAILPVIHQAFKKAGFTKKNANSNQDDWSKIDAIAVTHTPGLLGSLLIGTLTARMLAILHEKPLYAVHHLKSHIYANWLTSMSATPKFPLIALVVSGGHTQIIRMQDHNQFEIIGTTLDDAVGECFDKVAKILGLPYPGGPAISKAASGEIIRIDPNTNQTKTIKIRPGNSRHYQLPHPNIRNLDFSFSGLKTAVLRAVQKELNLPISFPSHELAKHLSPQQIADFAASFEETACDILLEKIKKALKKYPDTKSIVVAGGVSANQRLRTKAAASFQEIYSPEPRFSGDNAAMVGAAAFYEIASEIKVTDPYSLNILPRSSLQ